MEGWSIAVSVITAATAIIAIFISAKQIRVSNRQFLFETRERIILLIEDLMALFKSASSSIDTAERDEPAYVNDLVFVYLTNTSYLQDMANAIKRPLKDHENHVKLLSKFEELRRTASECSYVFSKKKWAYLSLFINQYVDFLSAIYQYRICIDSDENKNSYRSINDDPIEKGIRQKYYNSYDILKRTYNSIVNDGILFDAKKQVKL